ncbi:DUF742 domain-containing protein, partial [Streptomyces sp. McG7]|nr:DUF742 domain-containing protein [Streptomyces sp. McG7]
MTPPRRQRRTPAQGTPQPPAPARKEGEGGNPERLYVVAGPDGERADIDLVTLIVARSPDP